jgi:hypothetical protein
MGARMLCWIGIRAVAKHRCWRVLSGGERLGYPLPNEPGYDNEPVTDQDQPADVLGGTAG